MQTVNNNFTVEALVAKYRNFVDEHCPKSCESDGVLVKYLTGADYMAAFTAASAIGATISIFGDLAASAIKRNKDIKDYGRLIPGHGGILDRYDSVIFTAPIVYWVLYFIVR